MHITDCQCQSAMPNDHGNYYPTSFASFFIMHFLMGLSFYPMKQSTSNVLWTTCLSILYTVIIWFAYAYLYYCTVTLNTYMIYQSRIHLIYVVLNILSAIVSMMMSFYHQEKLKICMKRLTAVNDTLQHLGTPKSYQKMHMLSKQILIGYITYIFIMNFYDSLSSLKTEQIARALFLPYILNHCLYVNTLIDLLFIFFLWYIGTRFDKVIEHMQYLLVNEKHVSKNKWKKPAVGLHRYVICTKQHKQTLWTLMHLHLELCRIARELNLIFGIQMTFQMACYITTITILCFGINILLMQYRGISLYYWFGISCNTLIFIVKLCTINYIFECIRIKVKKTDKIFHQLTSIIRYADIWKEIYQFILQSIQHPLRFTGMGFFNFGNDFLRKLCTMIFMYIIIMTQMKIPIL